MGRKKKSHTIEYRNWHASPALESPVTGDRLATLIMIAARSEALTAPPKTWGRSPPKTGSGGSPPLGDRPLPWGLGRVPTFGPYRAIQSAGVPAGRNTQSRGDASDLESIGWHDYCKCKIRANFRLKNDSEG